MGCLCSKPSAHALPRRFTDPVANEHGIAAAGYPWVIETRERDSSSQQPLRTVLSARGGVDVHPPRNPMTALLGSCISSRDQYGEFHSSRKNIAENEELDAREDARVTILAGNITNIIRKKLVGRRSEEWYESVKEGLRTRLTKMACGRSTPPMPEAADKLLLLSRSALQQGRLSCANSDPGASLRQEFGARELTVESWQRSTDARMVNDAREMEPSEPHEWRSMARQHGEPCLTAKISMMFSATKHGITTETAAYERPPPSRSVNAVPGHTNPSGKRELLMLDGSLKPPDGMLRLMRLLAPATFGIALDENQSIDTVRLHGAATVGQGLGFYEEQGWDLVPMPDEFYTLLNVDPAHARAVPGSKTTPWGFHIAVKDGSIPFFVSCGVHPGSSLEGPNSRFWNKSDLLQNLLTEANTERALVGKPPIAPEVCLFTLYGFNPEEAGRRATARLEAGSEWMHPCVRGGETTAKEWARLIAAEAAGTISVEDLRKLKDWRDGCSRGGKAAAKEWARLVAAEAAGTISVEDLVKLKGWRDASVRGGETTAKEWARLIAAEAAGTISVQDLVKLKDWRDACVRGGETTAKEWARLIAAEAAGTISVEDLVKLKDWRDASVRGGSRGGKTHAKEWARLIAAEKAGTISVEDLVKLKDWRAAKARAGRGGNAVASVVDEIDAILKEQGDWMTYQQIFEVMTRRGRATCAAVQNIRVAVHTHGTQRGWQKTRKWSIPSKLRAPDNAAAAGAGPVAT